MKTRLKIPSSTLILAVAILIASVDNLSFWSALAGRLEFFTPEGFGLFLTYFVLITAILFFIAATLGQGILLKPVLITLLIVSSLVSYFNGMGVVFDHIMLENVVETIRDRNVNEATELVSTSLLRHLLFLGILPAIVVGLVGTRQRRWHHELLSRGIHGAAILTIVAALVMLNFKYLSYFSRENRDLRVSLTPLYPIASIVKLVKRHHAGNTPFVTLGADARSQHGGRRRVGIMVVGETSRWDHWSINGYRRQTNPLLEREDIISFSNAWSCGTSTAYSVPCMFSFLDRANYSPGRARSQSNVLDVLQTAGVRVIWRDNNSSCKGVCERIDSQNFHHDFDAESPFFHEGAYTDEILLTGLDELIDTGVGDVLIVLHTMGSHGPAYYRRYPERFARFQPACETNSPHECSNEAVRNAYDNTILYTDFILDRTIEFLRARSDRYDTFMLYAADHGESLGEHGVYLHGLPYRLAPEAQKHVPMLAWLSAPLKASAGLAGATGA